MPDWTDPRQLLAYVNGIAPDAQLKLIETERQPRLNENEWKYLKTVAELKRWNDLTFDEQQAELEARWVYGRPKTAKGE
jgi:hypothetical protein